jgi:type I restriction enzyme S subunit
VPLLFRKFCGAAPADLFLSDIADFQKGVSYRSVDLQDSSAAMVTLKSFDRNGGYKSEGLKPYVGKFKDSQVIGIGEFAVAQTDLTQGAEVVGRVVRIPRDSRFETLIASLDLIIVRPRSTINATYLYGVLLDPRFREHCRARTSGTTVLHLGSDALPNYPIPAAGEADQLAFAKAAEPLLKRQDQLDRESASLAKVRDSLLPELLSGRIRVRDAESIVEDAL